MKKQKDNWSMLASELGLEGSAEDNQADDVSENEVIQDAIRAKSESSIQTVDKTKSSLLNEQDAAVSSFGAGILAPLPDDPHSEADTPKPVAAIVDSSNETVSMAKEPKKTLFGRFARMNPFGTGPAKETPKNENLRAGFTSKTVETVPVSLQRAAKKETEMSVADMSAKEGPTTSVEATKNTTTFSTPPLQEGRKRYKSDSKDKRDKDTRKEDLQRPAVASITESLDPWSQIAAQVGNLSGNEPRRKPNRQTGKKSTEKNAARDAEKTPRESSRNRSERDDSEPNRGERRRGKKQLPSMFDNTDGSTPDEVVAVNNLFGSDESVDEAADRLDSLFNEGRPRDRRDDRSSRRGNRQGDKEKRSEDVSERQTEALPEDASSFGSSSPRVRGRRGSRYIDSDSVSERPVDSERKSYGLPKNTSEDLSEDLPGWDIEEESKPVERRPRGSKRNDRRSDRKQSSADDPRQNSKERRDADGDRNTMNRDSDVSAAAKSIPSWDDAISVIIEANRAKHAKRSSDSSRRGGR